MQMSESAATAATCMMNFAPSFADEGAKVVHEKFLRTHLLGFGEDYPTDAEVVEITVSTHFRPEQRQAIRVKNDLVAVATYGTTFTNSASSEGPPN